MTSFRFIHAADIHLDSPLRGLSRYEGVPADAVRLATRTALNNLIDAAIEEAVSFVVIAGDLYDGDWPDFGTGLFFCAAMGRLNKAGIAVYLLYGNHDAESVLTRKLPLPDNVHVFGNRKPTTFVHEETGVALHGWSYREKDTRENLAALYPAPVAGKLNIGVLHTALSGRPPHAPYAPCTPQELSAKGYDYWALGHVHDFEIVSTNPLIIYPGNLQGRNIRETGGKGAVLISVDGNQIEPNPRRLSLDAVRWAQVVVDVNGVENEPQLHTKVRAELQLAWDSNPIERPLMVRVTLFGKSSMHAHWSEWRDSLRHDIRGIAISISELIWIEKCVVNTGPVTRTRQGSQASRDDLYDLLAQGNEDQELRESLAADLAEFFAKAPSDLGGDDEFLSRLRRGEVAGLLQQAAETLQERLTKEVE